MAYHKLIPGQPWHGPSASLHNKTIEVIDWVIGQQRGSTRPPPVSRDRNTGIVTVQNNSGAAVDQLAVLGIDGAVFTNTENPDLFKSRVVLKGITPTAATHAGKFVVCLEPIPAGEMGKAYISGACPAKVNVSDAAHTYADAGSSSASLASGETGSAKILYKEAGTGTVFAVVLLGAGASPDTGGDVSNDDLEPGLPFQVKQTNAAGDAVIDDWVRAHS